MKGFYRNTILLTAFALLTRLTQAQVDAPDLRCLFVEDNGDVTLSWVLPSDPNGQFINYQVFYSVNGSNYLSAGILNNYLQNVYTHNGINFPVGGNLGVDYYMVTTYNDGATKVSQPSDTLNVMLLSLTTTGNQAGSLSWTALRSTPLPSWDPKYDIGRKLVEVTTPPTIGTWVSSYATPDFGVLTYEDTVVRCHSDVSYRVELKDASGCVSRSNGVEARLQDINGAAQMTYDQFSMNFNDGVNQLNWTKHPDGSVTNYIIVYLDPNGTAIFIDTVSASTFEYRDPDPGRSAHNASQCYQIIPLDSCGNSQGGGPKHCSMHLTRSYDPCAGEVYLKWNLYEGWNSIREQNVYLRIKPDSNFTKLGTVGPNDTSFVVKDVDALSEYAFYVEAIDGSGRFYSHSNLLGTKFQVLDRTEFLKIRGASVQEDNSIELSFLMDRKSLINHLNLYRGIDRNGPFKKIGELVPPGTFRDTLFNLYDRTPHPDQFAYTYYAEVVDTCDMVVLRSNKFRTLYLNGTSDKNEMLNSLFWNNNIYVDSSAVEVDLYSLYRGIDRNYGEEPIRVKSVSELFYTDDIQDEINSGSVFCYRLALLQANSDTFDLADTSYSNEVCFSLEPDIFIPNSFTPNDDGVNESWRPMTSYVIPFQNYLLRVFDRWGNLAFETTDPLEGWFGKNENGDLPNGIYVYRLQVTTSTGSTITREGQVTLVR